MGALFDGLGRLEGVRAIVYASTHCLESRVSVVIKIDQESAYSDTARACTSIPLLSGHDRRDGYLGVICVPPAHLRDARPVKPEVRGVYCLVAAHIQRCTVPK